ncbi:hypothetical protein E2562_005319 [Oryza meyeriana var. granulata]|uniref:Sterol methyltransferase C-terminal domain-containing protein n=1 Tax=Oryza meyeriana var. granulata TaxID=110450 RepID=A0A6G1DFE3_9ORYZ|nr:hypothetical protein E2562_005319 [Oryza meyeriana var. granulata]
MTDKYDPGNARHQSIKAEIELGNGLPDRTTRQCIQALKDAGFEVKTLECLHVAPDGSLRITKFPETAADGLVKGAK